jgi:hypothetical protein
MKDVVWPFVRFVKMVSVHFLLSHFTCVVVARSPPTLRASNYHLFPCHCLCCHCCHPRPRCCPHGNNSTSCFATSWNSERRLMQQAIVLPHKGDSWVYIELSGRSGCSFLSISLQQKKNSFVSPIHRSVCKRLNELSIKNKLISK